MKMDKAIYQTNGQPANLPAAAEDALEWLRLHRRLMLRQKRKADKVWSENYQLLNRAIRVLEEQLGEAEIINHNSE